jgi:type IV pilus assembly protein PilF
MRRALPWLCLALLCACSSTPKARSSQDAASANLQLGVAYLREGNLGYAKQKLERARDENPRSPAVHSALGLLYERLNDDKKADEEYHTAERLAPQDPDIINNYAVYLCRKDRVDEGVKRFEQAAANPLYLTPSAAYTNAGVCLRSAKRDDEARMAFARALLLRPDDSEAVLQLARLDFDQEHYAAAQARIDGYLNRNIATPDLLLLGWRIAQAQNDRYNTARFALRLEQEFPQSDQARSLATASANPS